MPAKKWDKDQIIKALQNTAEKLGTTKPRERDVANIIPISTICNYFGSFGNALKEAGLEKTSPFENCQRKTISDEELFHSLLMVEKKFGHEPGSNEYAANGEYSVRPMSKRFGKWNETLKYYRKWKAENPEALKTKGLEEKEPSMAKHQEESLEMPQKVVEENKAFKGKQPKQLFGELLEFRGLRHAPINEQGVVYLFGMVSRELGFSIESLQQGFPDCEGKYLHDQKKQLWAKARIEFEYRASSFKEHGHNAEECDFIVCWINDWPDCPINVIELQSEIRKLSSR